MGWISVRKKQKPKARELFINLSVDEQIIVDLLTENEELGIDEINFQSGLSSSAVAVAILNLEMQNVLASMPGKLYRLY